MVSLYLDDYFENGMLRETSFREKIKKPEEIKDVQPLAL